MRRNGEFPTLRAIAEKTGYSIMTVSRALNHPEVVKEDTRAAILSAVRELQYYPNSVARALSAGKTSIARAREEEELRPLRARGRDRLDRR